MASAPTPLRTALIGLSSSATTSWASAAHLPGLLSPIGREKLPITALLNSSVKAAQSAIATYQLSPETKAYGSPEDLANDPDVDLVICNTRVDKHFATILPSVKKGKDVFVEWPIAANLEDVETLVREAGKSGSRVAVGLQRRWAPPAVKLREIIKAGVDGKKLGKILSVDVRAYGGTNDRDIVPEGLAYFLDRKVGGNVVVIGNGHLFDTVLSVVGDLEPGAVSSKLQLQRPDVRVRDPSTNEIIKTVQSDVPDLVSLHGTLKHSSATLSYLFRRGQPFPGTPALTWTINFEHGEIRLVSPSGLNLELGEPVTIHVHWFDSDEVEEVKWEWNAEQTAIPPSARNVINTLVAFADRKAPGDGWVSLEDAANRARLIEGFLAEWEKSRKDA
ncbi:putative oxidoreductase [Karstenula rhodostoma CBS 690.94]|uniref:Oxidoreductase n=1 Tax=Karstenula rhodostoma CBS 690.94 TaxID=1392251 RepID=A0A9P4PRJ2_9PLEO|nr:putative oxidoreductase [Karstenula rhodostoma CBS 690.94]